MSNERLEELLETWINGNRKDAVEKLLEGNASDLVRFGCQLVINDEPIKPFLKMLENIQMVRNTQ